MDPCEVAMSVTILAVTLSQQLSDEELLFLSVIITQFADVLASIAETRSFCNINNSNDSKNTNTST